MTIHHLFNNVNTFLGKIHGILYYEGIDTNTMPIDHICYRVSSNLEYDSMKNDLSGLGELLSEAKINDRPISVFKLHNPIKFPYQKIYCVELPAPSLKKNYPTGLEHIEFVIKESFDDFMKKHSNIKFDISGMNSERNADIKIQYKGFSVKFHHKSIEEVIREEKEMYK